MQKDARKLSPEIQETKRQLALKLFKQKLPVKEIAKIVEVHFGTVYYWIRLYSAKGKKALLKKQRGRRLGAQRTLSEEQEKVIYKKIKNDSPEAFGIPMRLWTRDGVRTLIYQETQVIMPIRTISLYLKRWDFTPQKPTKKAYEQDPKRVERWLKKDYPALVKRAIKEDAEIHWGDETGIRNNDQRGRGYSPRGVTPTVFHCASKRISVNMISSITKLGKIRFMIFSEKFTAVILLCFLKSLIRDSKKKIFLILDNARVHHAKSVKEWVKKNKKQIEIFYLPPYSPEINPDEYINRDLKGHIGSRSILKTEESFKDKIRSHMRMLQRKESRVRKCFETSHTFYAA